MNRGISLYLDVTRFSAALVVFIGHAAGKSFTGGFLWPISLYLQTAVIVFFVLSGYVIAFVLNGRENTAREYVIARAARLYSITIPALLVTAICNPIGLAFDPALYYDGPWGYPEGSQFWNYVATLLFVNRLWDIHLEPGMNAPFWSLGFEAIYYMAAGLIVFTKGWTRSLSVILLFACAGPSITLLAPIWFMGYGIYYLTQRVTIGTITGWVLTIGGLLLLAMAPEIRDLAMLAPFTGYDRNFAGDYYEAIAFSMHLIGIHALGQPLGAVLGRFDKQIRWASSLTFALYLFHRPLIQVFAAVDIGPPESWGQRLYLLGGTFFVIATFGYWCDQQKTTLKRALKSIRWGSTTAAPTTPNRQV